MTNQMGYYNVEEFIKHKQSGNTVPLPPVENLLAAADHIRKLFEGKKFNYGIMGGLEMLCLGSRRELPDLQIAYDDKDFHKLKSKLESDHRIRLPEGMNSLFPAKLLVRTGPAYKKEGCTESAEVEVDLVPPGSHGTPHNGSLADNLALLSLKTKGKPRIFKGLNMQYLIKTLVQYCRVRDLIWDPRKDVLFLCQHYAEDVQSIRAQLDQTAVQQNFLATPFVTQLSSEEQRRCYQILLGTKPPPTMAITPPPPPASHKHSASDPNILTKSRLSSHYSSPSLNTQASLGLLSPPLPGKPRAASSYLPQDSTIPITPDVRLEGQPKLNAQPRESRTRYRAVNVSDMRANISVGVPITASKMTHIRQRSQPPSMSGQRLGSSMASMSHLQPPTYRSGMMSSQVERSIPNFKAENFGPVQPYAFAQTSALIGRGTKSMHYARPVEMSATPAPLNPGQQHLKSHSGVMGTSLPRQNQMSNMPITEHPVPPKARAVPQGDQLKKAGISVLPVDLPETRRFYVVNPDIEDGPQPNLAVVEPQYQTSSPPAELDAAPKSSRVIAELSRERSTPVSGQMPKNKQHVQTTIQPQQSSSKDADNSASKLPNPQGPTALGNPIQEIPIRPSNPRTISAPAAHLPAILSVGSTILHHHTQSALTVESAPTNTNAARYTRYYSTPQISPNSAYKAYQPSLSPPSIPFSPPTTSLTPLETPERQSYSITSKDIHDKKGHSKHTRDASHDSQPSQTSDSRELAEEYRRELREYSSSA